MHYPVASKRGEVDIPKENGKPVTEYIDYVDVSVIFTFICRAGNPTKEKKSQVLTVTLLSNGDIQSDGEIAENRKGESDRRL